MSNSKNQSHESQADRWLKYGSNVVLSCLLVVALGVGVVWFAQRANARRDMTKEGSLSLKPQTVNVLNELKQKITLVSLYARLDNTPETAEQAQHVADLLDEYKDKNSTIDVKIIDPAKEKDKLEDLHQEFLNRYGSQIKSYKDYLEAWKGQYDQLKKLLDDEGKIVGKFGPAPGADSDQETDVTAFASTITDGLPTRLSRARKEVDHELKQKHPDYKAASEAAKTAMETISKLTTQIIDQFAPAVAAAPQAPADFKKYVTESVPRYKAMKQIADDAVAKGSKLGELKVDELEKALNVDNPILVLGENEWRVLAQDQVWRADNNVQQINASGKVKPRFAGEQQVTTAIYALEHPKKQKVCFVRPEGRPLTSAGFMNVIPGGPLATFADHLRDYNFDVTEKDLSGTWAMQAQMQQMPSPPEPSDEDIKDAIWVVVDIPVGQEQRQTMPPSLGPKLKEHLDHGGSALILVDSRGDDLAAALTDWGVTLHPTAVAVHETIKLSESADTDWLEQAKAMPFIWDCRKYGDAMLVQPIQNLDSAWVVPTVVTTTPAKGCTITPIIPLSENMPGVKTWGETNLDDLMNKRIAEYEPDKGDLPSPVYAGAVVEKEKAGRLVVLGSVDSFTNNLLRIADPKLAQRDPPIFVNEFPGNLEVGTNSIFWLAKLEPMIAISPAAMDVSRIADMSNTMLNFWRIGVLLVLLPGVVLAAGAFVYVARRD